MVLEIGAATAFRVRPAFLAGEAADFVRAVLRVAGVAGVD